MKNISPEDFIVAWQTSESIQACAATTGLSYDGCRQRAKRLRKAGVKLKMMTIRRSTTFDSLRVAQLNALAKKYQP